MSYVGRHAIKINRAARLAAIGGYRQSFAAMLDAIPSSLVSALTAQQLADLIDANWRLAGASKKIAEDDIIANGFVWDHQRDRAREIAA